MGGTGSVGALPTCCVCEPLPRGVEGALGAARAGLAVSFRCCFLHWGHRTAAQWVQCQLRLFLCMILPHSSQFIPLVVAIGRGTSVCVQNWVGCVYCELGCDASFAASAGGGAACRGLPGVGVWMAKAVGDAGGSSNAGWLSQMAPSSGSWKP